MLSRRSFIVVGLPFASNCRRKRGLAFDGYAFVANEEGRSIAVVDLATFTLTRQVKLDAAPTAVLAHPGRPFIYALAPGSGEVFEIDIAKMGVSRRCRPVPSAVSMRLSPGPDHSALWVIGGESKKLVRVPLDSFRPERGIDLPMAPVDFDLARSSEDLCGVSYGAAGCAGVVDLASGKANTPAKIGGRLGTIRFRSDAKALLAANLENRSLAVLRSSDCAVISHLPLAVRPDRLCFNRDGGQLFITGDGMDAVVIVYPHYTPYVAETTLAGRAPGAMGVSANHLFVANPSTGDVSILNIETRRLMAVAAVGSEPGFITVTPDDQYALVLNQKSGDMAVIRIAAVTPERIRSKSAALLTMVPVGLKPVSAAVREIV